jgi:hypothetical protein
MKAGYPDRSESLLERLDRIVTQEFPEHPFSKGVTRENFPAVIGNYLTMSLAFPYLQAGAQVRLLFHYIDNDLDVPRGVHITAAVGAFLTWDETGGHAIVQHYGNQGLPRILDPDQFHSGLLRKDIRTLLGRDVPPAYAKETKKYLKEVHYGLSSVDPVDRVAQMVAFEKHAGRMIEALWNSTSALYGVDKRKLVYFATHVGGDDPAEQYHIQMTSRMIREVISESDRERFLDAFRKAYALNFEWCASVTRLGA